MHDVLSRMERAHDRLTSASFIGGQFCLFIIVFSYSYEVVARYFFAAPTWWSNEVVAYALCIGTFLALPQVTRDGGHIAITFLIDGLPPRASRAVGIGIAVVAALVCFFVAWICLRANIHHYIRNEMMVRVRPIPKFWISVWLTYGFLSAGLHFARMAIPRRAAASAG
jgi:C4-dicarboxylate transporter, DctQ subunit